MGEHQEAVDEIPMPRSSLSQLYHTSQKPNGDTECSTASMLAEAEFDPLIPTVSRRAEIGQPLRLPWYQRFIPLGTCFRSELATTENPFVVTSAFNAKSLEQAKLFFNAHDGDASYKSSESFSSSSSTDHLSVSVGAGISCPVLSASVSCQYDRDTMENNDGAKTSIMTSYRAGSVTFLRPPKLSVHALILLKYDGGLAAFKQRYGDYYVAGYRIGGDAGVMLSQSSSRKTESESNSVSLKVEVLFADYEENWSTSSYSEQSDIQVNVSGFSTLEKVFMREAARKGDPRLQEVLQKARGLHNRAQGLDDSIEKVLNGLKISHMDVLTVEQCEALCQSGAVVELLLVPVETLRELQYWITDTNIICL